jgi:hypothetical protein
MTFGQGFPSPKQPDKARMATCRAGSGSDSRWDAFLATVVGNGGSHLGEPGYDRPGEPLSASRGDGRMPALVPRSMVGLILALIASAALAEARTPGVSVEPDRSQHMTVI